MKKNVVLAEKNSHKHSIIIKGQCKDMEQQEIQEYCEAIREEIAGKNGAVEQIKNQL